ncbi:DUF2066 domain-containing protein [Chelativorans sp. AA-79]|uniref:DUF2066 domain-containing protein n=1 Tax=Chelativorans sp. AA-79 TaxID=3028735 RepID=UPI0023F9AAF3|nr:DUF2066 domain-containing protein [Chelativorans sp. AA-79]WEX09904.1 DUF2066 domain-containing protein [Chelativorans sp. AA-79]
MLFFFRPIDAWALASAVAILFTCADGALAADIDELDALYREATVITGKFENEVQRGFAECFERVLVKVSGDTDLAGSPAVVAMAVRAEEFVETYELHDRMAGIPVNDEQGTRDRPHVLSVQFSPDEINEALQTLGSEPWLDRPPLTLAVAIDNGTNRFLLAQDAQSGADQREALAQLGERYGLELVIPDNSALAAIPIDSATFDLPESDEAEGIRKALGAEALLAGVLVWNQEAFRWWSQWRLIGENAEERWEADSVSFDTVFRNVLETAVQELSGTDEE